MEYVLAAMMGYLLGSVPFALLVARRHGVDLYRTGDGNPGAWNALEQLGARRAWPVFFLCTPWANYIHGQVVNVTGGQFGGMFT